MLQIKDVVLQIKRLYAVIDEIESIKNNLIEKPNLTEGEKAQLKLIRHLEKIYFT